MAIKKTQRHPRAVQNGVRRSLTNIEHQKQEKKVKAKDTKALIIAQEIKFARLLACNDNKTRNKVLKNLKKWLSVRSKSSFQFTEADFMRLLKGLFYCMWMSDKPLVQEELAESLSQIVHCFDSMENVLLYNKCALKTLGTEWFGIDKYRLDKFAMLVRRILRQTFQLFHKKKWNIEWVKGFAEILEQLLLDDKSCLGFKMHIIEIYWEEIAKASLGNIPEEMVTELIKPFVAYMAATGDETLIKHIMKHIFRYLIFQSDIGLDYKEKFEAWKQAGFPCGSIDVMEKVEECDEDSEKEASSEEEVTDNTEKPLDPRAGRVDVELPQIKFNAKKIAELIKQYRFHPSSTAKSRRQIARLIQEFTELSEGRMPLGLKEIKIVNKHKSETDSKKAALRLLQFEEELYSDSNGTKKKRKKDSQLDENSFDSLEENVINEESEEESKKANNKKKKNADLKYDIVKTDEIMQSRLKDSGITKKPTLITNRIKNKQNKQEDRLLNGILKPRKCAIATLGRNKVTKNKIIKTKLNISNGKTPSKDVATNKLKKVKKLLCQWDVSDNPPASTTVLCNNDNKNKTVNDTCNIRIDKSTLNDTNKNNVTSNKEIAWLTPVLKKSTAPAKPSKAVNNSAKNLGAKKRVKIVLQRNTAQKTSDYIQQIRLSPAIPFDANKKPPVGVLKANPIPSPVNPFYKRQVK